MRKATVMSHHSFYTRQVLEKEAEEGGGGVCAKLGPENITAAPKRAGNALA